MAKDRTQVKCLNCGKKMFVLPCVLKTGRKKYCSKDCYSKRVVREGLNSENNNPAWKGDAVGYSSVHRWIEKHLGSPRKCEECKRTDKKKYEWANKDHKYRRVIGDYRRLCTSCHRKHDIKINDKQNVPTQR